MIDTNHSRTFIVINKAVIAVFALLVGCAPTVEYIPTSNAISARRVAPQAVTVFFWPPPCPYTQLGIVETSPLWPKSHNEQIWQMRTAAGQNGADAIIIAQHEEPGHHSNGGFTAIAIAMGSCTPLSVPQSVP